MCFIHILLCLPLIFFLNIGNAEMSNMESRMSYLHVTECQHLSCRWLFLTFVLKYFQAEHQPSIERIFYWPNAYLHRYSWLSDICVIAYCVYNIVQAWSRSRFVTMSHLCCKRLFRIKSSCYEYAGHGDPRIYDSSRHEHIPHGPEMIEKSWDQAGGNVA